MRYFFDLQDACGTEPGILCEWAYDLTGSETTAEVAQLMTKPVTVLLILAVAYVVNRIVRRAIRKSFARLIERQAAKADERGSEEVDDGRFAEFQERALAKIEFLKLQSDRGSQRLQALSAVMRSLASLLIWTVALMMALAEFDISLGPLLASAGIVGIALGFGAQSLVKDFLSGIFMLVEDQYGVGDIVDVGEAAGLVEAVNLRTTRLRDVHGTVWHIPNGEIRRVGNKSQQWARAVLDVEVAYDTDIDHAAAVIKRVADELWHEKLEKATILEEPQVWGVEAFGESSVVIRAVLKVEPGEQFTTSRELRGRLKEAFDAEGIEIPFPQRTVWMHQAQAREPRSAPGAPKEKFRASGAPEGSG